MAVSGRTTTFVGVSRGKCRPTLPKERFPEPVKRTSCFSHDAYGTGEGNNDSDSGGRQIGLKPRYLRHTRRRYQPFVPVNPAPGALATRAEAGGVPPEGHPGTNSPRGCHAARYQQRRCPQTLAASKTRYANQRIAPARRFLSSHDRALVPLGRAGSPRHAASTKASACLREPRAYSRETLC